MDLFQHTCVFRFYVVANLTLHFAASPYNHSTSSVSHLAGISRVVKAHYRKGLQKNLDSNIADEKLRRHMMPDYEMGCRRLIPSNAYLPALAIMAALVQ